MLVVENEVFENGTGILVMFAPNARVNGNHVHHNIDGISFVGSSGYATLPHAFRVGFNVAEENERDGISIQANGNRDLGIEAVSGVGDYGTNTASGNGDPRQCVNVTCS